MRYVLVVACLALAPMAQQTSPPSPAQQPPLTFRSAANYVEVDAIVTDANGNAVRNLTATDFDVTEDGRAQALSVCAFVDIPIVRPDPLLFKTAAIEPDVASNEKTFDGRVFLIVLDAYHVSAIRSAAVRTQAEKFIDRYMGENDIATVVHIGNPNAGQEFTNSRRLLKLAISRFIGQALPSITANTNTDSLARSNERSMGNDTGPARDNDAPVREFMARTSLSSLRRLADDMAQLGGRRKALLLFSEGVGIDMLPAIQLAEPGKGLPPQTQVTELRLSQRAMVDAAARGNVSIYTIDPRGLTTGMGDMTTIGMTPATPEGAAPAPLVVNLQEEVRRAQDTLREYADQTGGLAMVDKNDMDEAFARIVQDNSSYYLLGYQSPDPRHDGRFHRVSVKMKRPGLNVRTRQGYVAPSDKPSARDAKPLDPLVQMIKSPAPVGGLGMHLSASVIKGLLIKSTVHLTIEFSGKDVALKSSGSVLTNEIDVEYLAADMTGVGRVNARDTAHIQLLPSFRDAFPRDGVRYVTEFELEPGRYQLRVAARERLEGRTGSVFYELDVPDFTAPRLAISDLLITSSQANRTVTGNSTATLGGLLATPTTTVREFTAADTLTAAAAFYDNDARGKHQVNLKATVHSDTGAQVFARQELRDSKDLAAASGGFPWVVSVPLQGLTPGRYVLALEAESRLAEVPR